MLLGRFFRMDTGMGGTGGMEEERRVARREDRREERGGGWGETEGFVLRCANALRLSSEEPGNESTDCVSATLDEGKPTLGLDDWTGTGTGTAVTVASERGDASGLHISGSSKCTRERVLRRERDECTEVGVTVRLGTSTRLSGRLSGRPVRPRGPSESVSIRTSTVSDPCQPFLP
jgi:hypothetical protein